jgi:hypothetical protein
MTITIKHTPGPWSINDWPQANTDIAIGAAGTPLIARVPLRDVSVNEQQANAALIAAAPELLEALKWMVANDDTNEGDEPVESLGGHSWNEYNSYWLDGLNKARAAIAKATGETK